MSDEETRIIRITEMSKDIESNEKSIGENREKIDDLYDKHDTLHDICVETKHYQMNTHNDVKGIREDLKKITAPPAPVNGKKTDWGEWLVKNMLLILTNLLTSVVVAVVVYLITKALMK